MRTDAPPMAWTTDAPPTVWTAESSTAARMGTPRARARSRCRCKATGGTTTSLAETAQRARRRPATRRPRASEAAGSACQTCSGFGRGCSSTTARRLSTRARSTRPASARLSTRRCSSAATAPAATPTRRWRRWARGRRFAPSSSTAAGGRCACRARSWCSSWPPSRTTRSSFRSSRRRRTGRGRCASQGRGAACPCAESGSSSSTLARRTTTSARCSAECRRWCCATSRRSTRSRRAGSTWSSSPSRASSSR
mmetsp:Transcript_30868/g.101763  ORF Transcript_30868/g.101763 Transcript_30868/m.101763 type:complete len:253 (+) Transcript_30868:919-1677(+)